MKARAVVACAAVLALAVGLTIWKLNMAETRTTSGMRSVLPAPASMTPASGEFRLGAQTVVVAAPAAAGVAEYLSGVLRDATGHDVPVREAGSADAVRLALNRAPDGELGGEGYRLEADAGGVTVRANAAVGLFHGVQTLRQLLHQGAVPAVKIVDRPRFAYRGVMLDVARHFFGAADVKRVIDLAALLKLNYLHLHLTDDQGWRIAVDSWPRLATYGGGSQVGGGPGGFYTKEDYRQIVSYAASRYLTVIPEVDLPGHTNAALASYPELTCDGQAPPRYTGIDVGFSSLCVHKEITYQFLDDVLGALAALTPGPYLHIGGDEAKTLAPEDYATIVSRAQRIVAAHGKTAVGWHEVAGSTLLPSTVVQYWGVSRDDPGVSEAVKRGNQVILSPANHAYLDMKYNEHSPLGLSWAGYVSVAQAYDWDPGSYLSGVDSASILGVESPLWTETVHTVDEIGYLMMPRLAVTAELGWAPVGHDWEGLKARLTQQQDLWRALGVNFFAGWA